MLTIDIPGAGPLALDHLVLDYNGTLAEDGSLLAGVRERLLRLAGSLVIHVITADTHGTVKRQLSELPVQVEVIGPSAQDKAKETAIDCLGAGRTAAMGNGRNDARMLARAALGIVIMQKEGAAMAAFAGADVCCTDIRHALDLLLYPDRLRATLRN